MQSAWVDAVLTFWFEELRPAAWFRTDPKVDEEIRRRFLDVWERFKAAPPDVGDARAAVAAAVVLDQFPRNLFRGRPEAFATDAQALRIARAALANGWDRGLSEPERQFLYMPFQHSEDADDQRRSVELFSTLAIPDAARSAQQHKALIDRFGRFPHRNAVLGRVSTPEEVEHLARGRAEFEA
jgi:uncharacterized protein (DUF924 family)